jgi:predicted  nucleic acid-binding Zn-ribbon protein
MKIPKELQENTTKQVKELNKTILDLKMEIETIKKSQRQTTPEIENLGKRSRVIDASIIYRI